MKKNIYVLILSLVVVGGLVFTFGPFANGPGTNREIKNETKPSQKKMTIAEKKTHMLKERKKWEASPDGIKYKEWEVSPEGKKVQANYDKIKKDIKAFSNMEALVTSVTFKRSGKSSGIKWLIVSINGEDYMMQFTPKDFEPLKNLKVNDKIIVRSRSAGFSNNHPYLIISGDYISQNNKVLFKRDFSKDKGC